MDTSRDVILITGSSGLIGSAAATRLARQYRVAGFDNAGPPYPPAIVEAISVDLASDAGLDYAFERFRQGYGSKIASVIHLAAYYNFTGEPSPLYDEITVRGTQRMLRHLQKFEVEQFIFSSTMLVHAPCEPGQKINEDWPLQPTWDYPASKVKTEQLIHAERGGIPTVNLRISGVYDEFGNSIPLANQIHRIYDRKITSRLYPGDISRGQTFMHLEDLIDVLEKTVQKRKELGPEATFLIGEPETLSYDELQRTFGRLLHNEEWKTYRIPKFVAKVGAWMQGLIPGLDPFIKPWMVDLADDHYEMDISRARKALGWEPKHSLRATLPKMIEIFHKDPLDWHIKNDIEPPLRLKKAEL